MDCQADDWVCHALAKMGLDGFARETVQWFLQGPLKIVTDPGGGGRRGAVGRPHGSPHDHRAGRPQSAAGAD